MPIVQELVNSIALLVQIFFTILYWMLVARIVLSWFGVSPYTSSNEMLGALFQVTDAILAPFQKLPLKIGQVDLSPIVAFVVLQFVQKAILICLYSLTRGIA